MSILAPVAGVLLVTVILFFLATRSAKDKKIRKYREMLEKAYEDKEITEREAEDLENFRKELGLSAKDVELEYLQLYQNVFREVASDRYLTVEEAAEMEKLRNSFPLPEETLKAASEDLSYIRTLSRIQDGEISPVEGAVKPGPGEIVHFYFSADYFFSDEPPEYRGQEYVRDEPFSMKSDVQETLMEKGKSEHGRIALSNQKIYLQGKNPQSFPLEDIIRGWLYKDGNVLRIKGGRSIVIRMTQAELLPFALSGLYKKYYS